MKNLLFQAALLVIFFGIVLTSCTKEKIQPNLSAGKVVAGNTSTSSSTTSTSSHAHTGGCHQGSSTGTHTGN